jgi:NADH dehydrogenase
MILVAGGTGFIGGAVVRELAHRGERVAVLSHRPERARSLFPGLNVEVRKGDARDAGSLRRAVDGIDAVISSMQFPNYPVENPKKGYTFEEIDARGNERLVAAAKEAGAQTYVYLSGAGAAPDAAKHWFRAKWQAEQAIIGSGLRYSIFRPSWVYGPGDQSMNRYVTFTRMLPFVPVIGNGRQRMQPVFVEDVARCVADSLTSAAAANQVFEIGGPDVMTMNDVVRTMLRVMGKNRPILNSPVFLPRLAASVMGRLPNTPLSPEVVEFATAEALADNSGLLRVFDIRMTPLREGLATYLAPKGTGEKAAPSPGPSPTA